MAKLLAKDGKLVVKGGKFVFANNPAECNCCKEPPECVDAKDCNLWDINYFFRAPCGDYEACEGAGGTFFFEEEIGGGCAGTCRFIGVPAGTFPLPPCGWVNGIFYGPCSDGGIGAGPEYAIDRVFNYQGHCCNGKCQKEPCTRPCPPGGWNGFVRFSDPVPGQPGMCSGIPVAVTTNCGDGCQPDLSPMIGDCATGAIGNVMVGGGCIRPPRNQEVPEENPFP